MSNVSEVKSNRCVIVLHFYTNLCSQAVSTVESGGVCSITMFCVFCMCIYSCDRVS